MKVSSVARPLHLVTKQAREVYDESPRYIIPWLKLHRLYNTVKQHGRIMYSRRQRKKLLLMMKSANWLVVLNELVSSEAKYLGNIILAFYRIIKVGALSNNRK